MLNASHSSIFYSSHIIYSSALLSKPFKDRRHHTPRKVTRDAIHRWPLFVEKRLRVAGDFVLAAEDIALIIVEHFVLRLIAHGQADVNSQLKDPRPPEIIKQYGA